MAQFLSELRKYQTTLLAGGTRSSRLQTSSIAYNKWSSSTYNVSRKKKTNKSHVYIMARPYWEGGGLLWDNCPAFHQKSEVKPLCIKILVSTLKHIVCEVLWKYVMYKIFPHINNIHTRHFIQLEKRITVLSTTRKCLHSNNMRTRTSQTFVWYHKKNLRHNCFSFFPFSFFPFLFSIWFENKHGTK